MVNLLLLPIAQYFASLSLLVNTNDPLVISTYDKLKVDNKDNYAKMTNIYAHVSKLKYSPENNNGRRTDYWQTPAETIKIGYGDCDDLSILSASLYSLAGLRNFMALTTAAKWSEFHVSNIVVNNSKNYYLDASYPHSVGSLPFYANEARVFGIFNRLPLINPLVAINPVPLITFLENKL